MLERTNTDFNISGHLIQLMQDEPFYAEVSRRIVKIPTTSIPGGAIAGVCYEPRSEMITMYYNPEEFRKMTNVRIRNVIIHELSHVIFGHISTRRCTPHMAWNIATDAAINSIIVTMNSSNEMTVDELLPLGCVIPGQWPKMPDGSEMTKEMKERAKLAEIIASWPLNMASEWYFQDLMTKIPPEMRAPCECSCHNGTGSGSDAGDGSSADDEGQGEGGGSSGDCDGGCDKDGHGHGGGCDKCNCEGEFSPSGDHSSWDKCGDTAREYIEGKVRSIVEAAARVADQTSKGWGSVPAELREQVRQYVSNVINWKNVLRQFIGNTVHGGRSTSIKRINRRYPYIHPGIKRGWVAKLLVAIDQSGSVGDEMLAEFFGELGSLTKKVTISVVPFDCACNELDVFEWRKGAKIQAMRTKCGGTDFSAPTHLFNDPAHRGRWDGLIILTDGQAPPPIPVRGRRAWVLGRNCKLEFETTEPQIVISDAAQLRGAWR
jgi:predicted metal-dependent peptidase